MLDILLEILNNLPIETLSETLIASSLALLVWFVAKMKKKLQDELSKNGGSSTKDVLLRLEKNLNRLEQEVQFTNATFRFLHYSSNYCGFRTDTKGKNTMVTDSFVDFMGLHETELLGMEWLNVIPIEHGGIQWRDRVLKEFNSCLELHKTYNMVHPIIVRRNEQDVIKYIKTTAYPVILGGELCGTVGGFIEIPDDKS